MPQVISSETGQALDVSDDVAARMVGTGRYALAQGQSITAVSPTGQRSEVDAPTLRGLGARATTAGETADVVRGLRQEEQYGQGLLNKAKALGEGVASGLTLGLVNPLLDDEASRYRRENSAAFTVGDIAGSIGGALATGGLGGVGQGAIRGGGGLARAVLAATPAGLVGRAGGRIAARGGLAAAAGGAAFEGAAGNAGYYLSDVALGDRKLSAEGFVGAMGQGALFGGAAGGAAHGLERGFVRARKMFPRVAGKGGKDAARSAEIAFETKADDALAASDEALSVARRKLAEARAKVTELGNRGSGLDVQIAQERLALDQAKRRTGKGGDAPAPSSGEAPTPEASPEASTVAPEVAVDEAAPSPVVAEGSGPTAGLAKGSGEIDLAKLERNVRAAEEARDSVRSWITARKKTAGAGDFTTPVREGVEHARVSRTQAIRDAQGNEITDAVVPWAKMPDERLAWQRPRPTGEVAQETAEDYDDLIRRAAESPDESTRESLLREAADLEEQAFDASPLDMADAVRAARERTGLDGYALAKRRLEREVGIAAKGIKPAIDYSDFGKRASYPRRPDPGDAFAGVMDEANARLRRFGIEPGQREVGQFVADAEEAIAAMGRFDRAHADLVETLGADAPPTAKALADEHATAIAEHARKSTERSAILAEVVAETRMTPKEVQERLAVLRTQKLELGVEAATARRAVKEAGAEVKALAPARTKGKGKAADVAAEAAPEETGGLASKALEVGTMLEVLQTMGVSVPDVDRLPVVGPVLGFFLKARAARALLGRGGGRVAASAEARVASKAAATRDKIATSVDRMLGLGTVAAKVGKRTAGLAAARTAALSHRLFDDGETRAAPQSDAEAVTHRVAELAAAQAQPGKVRQAVRRQLHDALDPDIIRAVEEVAMRKLAYLGEHMPKEPPPSLLGRRPWRPSHADVDRFARRVRAAEDPASVFDELADGSVTPEAAETLREVYPELYAEAQMRLVERAGEIAAELPYQHVIKLGVLFDAPLVASLRPERMAAFQMQTTPQPAPAPPAGSVSGPPPNLSALYETAAHRRSR